MKKTILMLPCLCASSYALAGDAAGMSPIDGFAALFIFMLSAFTGHEIIGTLPII